MATVKSSAENLTLNADGSGNDIIFQSNGSNIATLDQAGLLTATTFAGSGANLTNVNAVNGGRKNIIINGAMNVAQRSTSVTGITSNSYNACDRWKLQINDAGTFTMAQEALTSGAAYEAGFGFATRLDCTTADASVAAGSYLYLKYMIEGQDLIRLSKGTSSARAFTVSFWVKTTTTGVYQLSVRDQNTRMCAGTYTVSSADTWEKKSITIAADTSGAIANSNAEGLALEFWLAAGSNYTGGTAPTAWEAKVDTDRAASLSHQMSSATSKDWAITGVQLEVGSTATDFEHRSYGEELALCQRYYQSSSQGCVFAGFSNGTSNLQFTVPLAQPLRASPTLSLENVGGGGANLTACETDDTDASSSTPTITTHSTSGVLMQCNCAGFDSLVDMRVTNLYLGNMKLKMDTEL